MRYWKFSVGQRVQVIAGNYVGCVGRIRRRVEYSANENSYWVRMVHDPDADFIYNIREKNLRSVQD